MPFVPTDLPPSCVSVNISTRVALPAEKKITDPVNVAVERFCRMMTLDPRHPKRAPNDVYVGDELSQTNVAKELKTSGVTHNIELEHSLPKPSDKNRTKQRKVSSQTILVRRNRGN